MKNTLAQTLTLLGASIWSSASFAITDAVELPVPGGLALIAIGLAALVFHQRKK